MKEKSREEILSDIERLGLPKNRRSPVGPIMRENKPRPSEEEPATGERRGSSPAGVLAEPHRRLEDDLPRSASRVKREITSYAFGNGFAIVGFAEWFRSLLSHINPKIEFLANRHFLLEAFAPGESRSEGYSIAECLTRSALAAEILMGGKEEKIGDTIEASIKEEAGLFAHEFLSRFYPLDSRVATNLKFTESLARRGSPVTMIQLAWTVRALYRLVLQIEGVDHQRVLGIIKTALRVHLSQLDSEYTIVPATRRAKGEKAQAAAESLIGCINALKIYRRDFYPALLHCLGAYYEYEDRSGAKRAAILGFTELTEEDVLDYRRFEDRRREEEEARILEVQRQKMERLERAKQDDFSHRFAEGLEAFSILFPESGMDKLENRYLLPYFTSFFSYSNPMPDVIRYFSKQDPMRYVEIFYRILWDFLSAINGTALESVLDRSDLAGRLNELKGRWLNAAREILEPYEDELEYVHKRTGSEREIRLFFKNYAHTSMHKFNAIRRVVFRQFKSSASRMADQILGRIEKPESERFYVLVEDVHDFAQDLVEEFPGGLEAAQGSIGEKMMADLLRNPVIELSSATNPEDPDFKPTVRQVVRFAEAIHHRPASRINAEIQVTFFGLFREFAAVFHDILSSPTNILGKSPDEVLIAGQGEGEAWAAEGRDRSYRILAVRDDERYQDSLTGIPNRMRIESLARTAHEKVEADGLCFALCDIDHFKKFNDTYGHQVGDLVLRKCAEAMGSVLEGADAVGRWGGEEFLFILRRDWKESLLLMERVRDRVEKIQAEIPGREGETLSIRISVGLASAEAFETYDEILGAADKALYYAKNTGRNRVAFYDHFASEKDVFFSYGDFKDTLTES